MQIIPLLCNAGILDKEPGNNGKEKLIWHELSSKYDTSVKSINQLSSRLSEIFPKIQLCKYSGRDEIDRRHQRYLLGVGFAQNSTETVKTSAPSAPNSTPVDTVRVSSVSELAPQSAPKSIGANVGADSGKSENFPQRDVQSFGADGADVSSPFAEFLQWFSKQPQSERENMVKMLTQLQSQPEQSATPPQPKSVPAQKGLRVRYIGTKHAEQLAGLELVVDAISKYREITCVKPDGSFTTWLDPKDLEVAE